MALDIPKEPKIYTTKYRDFRGVDYTNDPSNVWYRRSPNGVNMLPDLDGKPYKRHGWETVFSSADFCEAANISPAVDVEQYKVDYFELGGSDWLIFFTSLGLFVYVDELHYIDTYRMRPYVLRGKTHPYQVGECAYTTSGGTTSYWLHYNGGDLSYTGQKRPMGLISDDSGHWKKVGIEECVATFPRSGDGIDFEKSFFFEGQGDAGYYIFSGNSLFVFDGEIYNGKEVLKEVNLHVPIMLYACDASGTGTVDEAANLLTQARYVQYSWTETTDTFTVPLGFDTETWTDTSVTPNVTYKWASGIYNVYVRNASGKWITTYNWSLTGNDGVEIQMSTTSPPNPASGEDNLRIQYIPAGITTSTPPKDTSKQTLKIKRTQVVKVTQRYNSLSGQWVNFDPKETITYSVVSKPTFSVSSIRKPATANSSVYALLKNGTSWNLDATRFTQTADSYGSKITVSAKNNGKDAYNFYVGTGTTGTHKEEYGEKKKETDSSYTSLHYTQKRTLTVTATATKSISVKLQYTQLFTSGADINEGRDAFLSCGKTGIFGNGIINQVFLTASETPKYNTRVWYSNATDPTYFPDTNYMEVGATDKKVVGLIRVGDYLGIVKQGGGTDTSVYLAYPTSFENQTVYAVKQSINGIGALSNGAFNILNDEPLFLSAEGVMGIEPAEDENRKIRNRSFYINKKLQEEASLESAASFIYDGMYWLATGNHCYVLDGSQKISWENTKTNLQYECYYLDNVPAKCFAKKDDALWFIDYSGNVCRFSDKYVDSRSVDDIRWYCTDSIAVEKLPLDRFKKANDFTTTGDWTNELKTDFNSGSKVIEGQPIGDASLEVTVNGTDSYVYALAFSGVNNPTINANQVDVPDLDEGDTAEYVFTVTKLTTDETIGVNEVFWGGYPYRHFTVVAIEDEYVYFAEGVPVKAVWGTIADDDGSAHYLKNLQKKGSLVSFLPNTGRDTITYIKKDENEVIPVGKLGDEGYTLPFHKYLKKKMKKYKRLQIICENNSYDSPFGIDQIIKCYTIGNYAKK